MRVIIFTIPFLGASMPQFPNDADGQVLADLYERGIDLSRPLDIEFPVAIPDEDAAQQLMRTLIDAGYNAEVQFDEGEADLVDPHDPAGEPAWTVYVHRQMVPDYHELLRIQADLDRLAEPFGGFSDGWGVLIGE